jgi:pantoate--beta-alanine ligase
MYPEGFVTSVCVDRLTEVLEGSARPGHFRGVTTIVAKLFHVVQPQVAVFGQKDAQQVAVIRRMVEDLNFDVSLIVGPTVREADGLAMSSRNRYLSPDQRSQAPVLFRALREAERLLLEGERDAEALREVMRGHITTAPSASLEYVSVADADSLGELEHVTAGQPVLVSLAVRFGSTRLIDNIQVRS